MLILAVANGFAIVMLLRESGSAEPSPLTTNGIHILILLNLIILGLGYLLSIRHILRPIRSLQWQARELAAGNYSARSRLYRSIHQLDELGQALNHSAHNIEQLLLTETNRQYALQRVKAMFDGLASNSMIGIFIMESNLRLSYANDEFFRINGSTAQTCKLQDFSFISLFASEYQESIREKFGNCIRRHSPQIQFETQVFPENGSAVDVKIFASSMQLDGRAALAGIVLDITQRKRNEAAIQRAALVYQHTTEAMLITDAEGTVTDSNPAFTTISGYDASEVSGQQLMTVLRTEVHDEAFYQSLWEVLKTKGRWRGDIWSRRKTGDSFIAHATINATRDAQNCINSFVCLFIDVTKRRRQESLFWQQAHHDHLTQLPNRKMFEQSLSDCLQEAHSDNTSFALIFLDLDGFKQINDTYGHSLGDALLLRVAQRLKSSIRSSDLLCRLGGDEFTIIIRRLQRVQDVTTICNKVCESMGRPFVLDKNVITIQISAGVSIFPENGKDAISLVKHADMAMYRAKNRGRDCDC